METFFPPFVPSLHFQINYRNHRKLLIVDGVVGYIGGFNVGDEYVGKGPLGYWRDTHLRFQGSAVGGMELRFVQDWNYGAEDPIQDHPISLLREYREEELRPCITGAKAIRHVPVQMVSGGPDVVAVEVDYLSGFDLPLRLKTARREAPEDQCFFFTLEDPYHGLPLNASPSACFRVRCYDADGKLLYESPYPARWLEYPILDSHLKVVTP